MNQHLLVKIPERRTDQLGPPHRCVANLGKAHNTRVAHGASFRLAKAGPMSGAIAVGLTYDWRLDLDRSGAPGSGAPGSGAPGSGAPAFFLRS